MFFLFRTKRTKKARPFVFSGVVCLCSLKCPRSRDRIGRHFRALANPPALRPEKSDGQDFAQGITNLSGSSTCRSATPKNPTGRILHRALLTPAAAVPVGLRPEKSDGHIGAPISFNFFYSYMSSMLRFSLLTRRKRLLYSQKKDC